MAITDEIIGVSQLLGARARAVSQNLRIWRPHKISGGTAVNLIIISNGSGLL